MAYTEPAGSPGAMPGKPQRPQQPGKGEKGGNRDDITMVSLAIDPARFEQTVAELKAAGLVVDQSLAAIGAVIGRVSACRIPDLSAIDGVIGAERQRTVRLSPPESGIQ